MENTINGEKTDEKVPFEVALDKTGYGAYTYRCTGLAAVAVISYACVCYNSTILVPASACDLGTTLGQQGSMVAAPYMAGVVGSVLCGYLSDRHGRWRMLVVALTSSALVNALASLSINWLALLMLQCCSAFLAAGIYPIAMTLLSESVPLVRRNQTMLVVSSLMMVSQGVMAVLAIPIIPLTFSYYIPALGIYWNSWRTLMLVYSLPGVIAFLGLYFYVQESPKFILAKGNTDQALRILRIIHRVNKGTDEFQVEGLISDQPHGAGKPSTKDHIVPLFKPPLRKYTLIMTLLFVIMQFIGGFLIWLPKISNQFIKLLQTGEGSNMTLCSIIETSLHSAHGPNTSASCSLNVTALLMVLVVSGMQFVSNGILSLAVDRFGRRNSVMVLVTLCGASGALVNLVPNAIATAIFFGGFLVGIIVVGAYTAIAVALFPTHLRTLAVAFTLTGGRLCGFFTIQIVNYLLVHSCRLGFYLFAAVFASSALVLTLLPDDRYLNKPRCDDQAEEGVALKPLVKPPE
ncbi:uncharacterized protein [Choristoneura fumiferana]|uniref:uncharacterized protein n=1 Tax=Choristoneura fumiferana TaxID=7141 RepID=UPI003D157957